MNIAEYSIRKKTITLVFVVLLILGGVSSYEKLGRLEDPTFTIKDALVITQYPGATPDEVALEVTDKLETAIQQMAQLKRVESMSRYGLSIITVKIKDHYTSAELPQVWDELRRKVNDVQGKLPAGVQPSVVNDDFGDVYGVLLAVYGDGFSYRELDEYIKFLRKELLLVKDVAKITLWGEQQEAVFVEISREKAARLGVGLDAIYDALQKQNTIVPAGSVKVGPEYITLNPTGAYASVEDIAGLTIIDQTSGRTFLLSDVAKVSRGYIDPPSSILRFNSKPAIAIGVSVIPGGNVVNMGRAVEKRLRELEPQRPWGIELGVINFQSTDVSQAVKSFVVNFIEAVAIVIVVLLIFMGLRSGLLIGVVLALTVLATMIVMDMFSIDLQRISLGALVIALGMLVDNAIVVTEGMLIRIEAGRDRLQAAKEVVGQNMAPLLGATIIAVMAFAAIGLSDDNTGEYCRSLFQVMLISLMLSWVIAITITPLFCTMFLKGPKAPNKGDDGDDQPADPYGGAFFRIYRLFLEICLRFRWPTVLVLVALLAGAFWGFGQLKDSFFPASSRGQFMIHYWLPPGTDIRETSDDIATIEKALLKDKRIVDTASFIGSGAPRFILTFQPEKTASKSYGLILATVKDYRDIDALVPELDAYVTKNFPEAQPKVEKFQLGPSPEASIEVRFSGPDQKVLRELSNRAQAIMAADPETYWVRDNWRPRIKVIRPVFDQVKARQVGITRPTLNTALETAVSGTRVGVYREDDKLIPIISRAPESERMKVENLNDVQVFSPITRKAVPVWQIVKGFETDWESDLLFRRNRKLTITALCEPVFGQLPSVIMGRIKPKIDAMKIPPGYEMEWGGVYESGRDAQAGLASSVVPSVVMVVLILIILFNAIRQPVIILLTVPLAVIGVSAGLLAFDLPFDFMALLGFLSLSGMLIKNSIVLLDQINIEREGGKPAYPAIIDACLSRMRPVAMAAATTVLGMIPLLKDVFFQAMAVTIMCGLSFATILTLIVVPVIYAMMFRVKEAA